MRLLTMDDQDFLVALTDVSALAALLGNRTSALAVVGPSASDAPHDAARETQLRDE